MNLYMRPLRLAYLLTVTALAVAACGPWAIPFVVLATFDVNLREEG